MADPTDYIFDALDAGLSRPVGDGRAPDDTSLPYAIFNPGTVQTDGGTVTSTDYNLTPQVTVVGAGRRDCQHLANEARAIILALRNLGSLDVMQEASVLLRRMLPREDKVNPPVFTLVEQYQLLTTPATA